VIATTALAWLVARPARAYYEESHLTGDEVRVTVDASGSARVEHTLSWRVIAGQPRSLDLVGVEPSAQPEPSAKLESEDGQAIAATVTPLPGRGLRLTITEPKALRHGQQYRVSVAYAVNLIEAGELERERSTYRLAWKSPVPPEGYDDSKVTFVLPSAPEAPAALVGEGGMPDNGVTSTLRREPEHDELQLTRPHVGRGEDVQWVVRTGARAFEGGRGPALAPPPPPPRHEDPAGPGGFAYGLVAILSLAFASTVHWKERRFGAASKAHGPSPRGLVPLRSWERAAAAGAALFVGVSLQLVDAPTAGAVAVVVAMICTVLRPSDATLPPRGPGRWLVLRPEEAFKSSGLRRRLDRRWLVGAAAPVGATGLFFLAARLLAPSQPEALVALPLDALVLLPLFATGASSQLPPDRAEHGRGWLAGLFRRLQRNKRLRVSPWVRVPTGLGQPDEVRVLVLPREPMPGFGAIEVGFAWGRAATSFFATPEVLVRVEEATAASARMTTLFPEVIPVPGRKPEERVYRLAPRLPTREATAALVESLGRQLRDRRVSDIGRESEERRVPPEVRAHGAPETQPSLG
jgi:hypothetical protein